MRWLFFLCWLPLLGAEESPEPPEPRWPSRTQTPKPALQALPEKDGATIWSTPHFIIVCEISLPQPRLQNFAQTMESLPRLFKQLPLPLWKPPESEKAVVRLCRNETSFVARGAPVNAAGCYHPRSGEILIRGDLLLNPPSARATRLQPTPNEDLLIHELTHLAMHQYGGALPSWLGEGLAEYFAACHTSHGSYDFSQSNRLIKQHIEKFYPPERFPTLVLPPLATLAGGPPKQWLHTIRTVAPEDRYRQYAAALLLAHYHLEGGLERRKTTADYLHQALLHHHRSRLDPLIENPKEVEKRLTTYWKSKGLALKFEDY